MMGIGFFELALIGGVLALLVVGAIGVATIMLAAASRRRDDRH